MVPKKKYVHNNFRNISAVINNRYGEIRLTVMHASVHPLYIIVPIVDSTYYSKHELSLYYQRFGMYSVRFSSTCVFILIIIYSELITVLTRNGNLQNTT